MEAAYVKVSRPRQALLIMLIVLWKETVGEALKEGLAEVALVRPVDPIEYLSSWLLQYKENKENAEQVSKTSSACIVNSLHDTVEYIISD